MDHSRAWSAERKTGRRRVAVREVPDPPCVTIETGEPPMKSRDEVELKLAMHEEQATGIRTRIDALRLKEADMEPDHFAAAGHRGTLIRLLRQYLYECSSMGALRFVLEG